MKFPKWKYRVDPVDGKFQSTLVGSAEVETQLGATWTDDPHAHGIKVVPYPAEISLGGVLMHHKTNADANGNFAFGPAPTAPGISGSVIGGR